MDALAIQGLTGGRHVAKRPTVVRRASSLVSALGPAGLACLSLTGCFYLESINQRPAIDIIQKSSDLVYRRSHVELLASSNDPEGQVVFFQWRAYTCVDANDFATCDRDLFADSVVDELAFDVPPTLADGVTPTQSILVILEAKDEYGAIARPRQQLIIPVANHVPVMTIALTQANAGVVNTPVDLFVKVADLDDGPASVTLDWQVFTPMQQPGYDISDINVDDPTPTLELQYGKRIVPMGEGTWNVVVTATDPLGATDQKTFTFDVGPDDPPCLSQWSPITAPAGSSYVLTEPTLFQISVVTDDLDPYPAVPGNMFMGTTEFAWQVKLGANAWTPLGFDGNGVALDPATYSPGDLVQLRVEIQDRKQTPVNCPDTQLTCSVISNACIQRLTWRLEVR
jgi:hypothetical protein